MKYKTTHKENLNALRRINGQVEGVQRMIEDSKYCIDVIIQIHAAIHALHRVADKIFIKHIESCVKDAFLGKSNREKTKKINELIKVIKDLHKLT
ncbi:MAG: metal-sensitive transcriptional regulator [Candidatus Omnitrophica bacterium]|nr:metal-sensitive transcriptional regulator [Candidatus Omnitrophota bacterium]